MIFSCGTGRIRESQGLTSASSSFTITTTARMNWLALFDHTYYPACSNLDKSSVVALPGIDSSSNNPNETSTSSSIPLPSQVLEAVQTRFDNEGDIQTNDNNNSNHSKAEGSSKIQTKKTKAEQNLWIDATLARLDVSNKKGKQ